MFEKKIDRDNFKIVFRNWHDRKITIKEGMEKLGINCRASWYRIARELGLIK